MSQPSQIDPRGPQFTAALTSVVLALVLLTAPSPFGTALLAVQAALFAVGVALGVQRGPWAVLFRRVVRPRLAPPAHLEDPAPPRFAQGVGLVFALVALAGYLAGAPVVGAVATVPLLPGLRDVPVVPPVAAGAHAGERCGEKRP